MNMSKLLKTVAAGANVNMNALSKDTEALIARLMNPAEEDAAGEALFQSFGGKKLPSEKYVAHFAIKNHSEKARVIMLTNQRIVYLRSMAALQNDAYGGTTLNLDWEFTWNQVERLEIDGGIPFIYLKDEEKPKRTFPLSSKQGLVLKQVFSEYKSC
eukprot:TRINITY_DN11500_c0_g1::TRINITY_DN11500_c0_g1_i1::g.10868::m.10868 TRINITY_DN11500_c0_g1::TRINITY_DN11500_c0_g1_i1::g.10868  ORF type:complete len:157 (-),score=41.39,bPH_3/PF14470.1/0.25 TRINITY_DN11500_c0_g1_i1:127-597(-)